MRSATLLVAVLSAACGPSTPPDATPVCQGVCDCSNSCRCGVMASCQLGVMTDGGAPPSAVHLDCESQNTCSLTAGHDVSSTCSNRSTCSAQLGAGATVKCLGGATCSITAGADAGLTCADDSTCAASLGRSSTVCTGHSVCRVTCTAGPCDVRCENDANCSCTPSPGSSCNLTCRGNTTSQACGTTLACGSCP